MAIPANAEANPWQPASSTQPLTGSDLPAQHQEPPADNWPTYPKGSISGMPAKKGKSK